MAIIQTITINNSTSATVQDVQVLLRDLDLSTQRTLTLASTPAELTLAGNQITIDTTSSGFGSSTNLSGEITVTLDYLGQPCTNVIPFTPEYVLISSETIYEFNSVDEPNWSLEDDSFSEFNGRYELVSDPADFDIVAVYDITSITDSARTYLSNSIFKPFVTNFTAANPNWTGSSFEFATSGELWLTWARTYGKNQNRKKIVIICFIDESHPSYHGRTMNPANYGNQPTNTFIAHRNVFLDDYQNYYDYFKGLVYAIPARSTSDVFNHYANFHLHVYAAVEGRIIPSGEFIQTLVPGRDISAIKTSNPYTTLSNPNNEPTPGLKYYGWFEKHDITPGATGLSYSTFESDFNSTLSLNIIDNSYYHSTTTNTTQINATGAANMNISFPVGSELIPANTEIKYLISVDGRNTWGVFTDATTFVIKTNNASLSSFNWSGTNSMTSADLTSFTFNIAAYNTIDFAIALKTDSANVTPSLDEMRINISS